MFYFHNSAPFGCVVTDTVVGVGQAERYELHGLKGPTAVVLAVSAGCRTQPVADHKGGAAVGRRALRSPAQCHRGHGVSLVGAPSLAGRPRPGAVGDNCRAQPRSQVNEKNVVGAERSNRKLRIALHGVKGPTAGAVAVNTGCRGAVGR